MTQFARPDADLVNQGWTDQAAGSTNIFQAIDESVSSDADYVESASAPTTDVYAARLSDITDPAVSTGHVLRTRYGKDVAGGAQIDEVVQLRLGYIDETTQGTLIVARTFTNASDTPTTDAYTLAGAEADAITDYTDLAVRITGNQV